eukprot:comp20907_c0_seq1/m.43546 comp20907_c0_seq1/g.43546  ORF comp20907_c0_seq1/g.43546 comp20907_c0_seq1/m.43546 type:complete len:305 (+) comp20907_c0_seq1:456-1370(+)
MHVAALELAELEQPDKIAQHFAFFFNCGRRKTVALALLFRCGPAGAALGRRVFDRLQRKQCIDEKCSLDIAQNRRNGLWIGHTLLHLPQVHLVRSPNAFRLDDFRKRIHVARIAGMGIVRRQQRPCAARNVLFVAQHVVLLQRADLVAHLVRPSDALGLDCGAFNVCEDFLACRTAKLFGKRLEALPVLVALGHPGSVVLLFLDLHRLLVPHAHVHLDMHGLGGPRNTVGPNRDHRPLDAVIRLARALEKHPGVVVALHMVPPALGGVRKDKRRKMRGSARRERQQNWRMRHLGRTHFGDTDAV